MNTEDAGLPCWCFADIKVIVNLVVFLTKEHGQGHILTLSMQKFNLPLMATDE